MAPIILSVCLLLAAANKDPAFLKYTGGQVYNPGKFSDEQDQELRLISRVFPAACASGSAKRNLPLKESQSQQRSQTDRATAENLCGKSSPASLETPNSV